MNNKIKFVIPVIVSILILFGCSFLKEKVQSLKGEKSSGDKEETVESTSSSDVDFYNKYINAANKLTENVDNTHNAFVSEVPEPSSLKPSSMVFVISFDVYNQMLETEIKNQKRSLFDGGELSKISADNEEMKSVVEANFKELLNSAESYNSSAKRVIEYYKNKEYEKDVTSASRLDSELKANFKLYEDSETKLSASLKKYKPLRKRKDPDDYSNKDEKAVVILLNGYEAILEKAEEFYSNFDNLNAGDDLSDVKQNIEDIKRAYDEETKIIMAAEYSESTKYMKYSYEDYFGKMCTLFLQSANEFIRKHENRKAGTQEFNTDFDEVIRAYNNMINAYNTSISTLNTFRSFQ